MMIIPIVTIQHTTKLSALLQEYITSICSCGDITVTVIVTNCTDKSAKYKIQLIGVMASDAVLSLITDMEGLTEGLDLGIAVIFLKEHNNSLESNCDDKKEAVQTETVAVIVTLSVIIAIMLTISLMFIVYQR